MTSGVLAYDGPRDPPYRATAPRPVKEPQSGPFDFAPGLRRDVDGEHGGTVLARALEGGPSTDPAFAVLHAWWEAATAVLDDCPADRFELDVRPRAFLVSDGQWQYTSPGPRMRFRVPRPVMAFRALLATLEEDVLTQRWLPGLAPWTSNGAVVGGWLHELGMHADDAVLAIFVELEIDILRRTGRSAQSPGSLREEQQRRLAQPVVAAIEWLPSAERRKAAVDIATYREPPSAAATDEYLSDLTGSAAVERLASGIKIQELRARLVRTEARGSEVRDRR